MRRIVRAIAMVLWILPLGGCRAAKTPPDQTIPASATQSLAIARAANERGLHHAQRGELAAAEKAFREALAADVSYAAAHNNLALVLLDQKKYYEAATELGLAAKLAPRATEPLINLGRLYEAVGWMNEALESYEKALNLDGDNSEAMGRLASAKMRSGQATKETAELLRALANGRSEDQWTQWARSQLQMSQELEGPK